MADHASSSQAISNSHVPDSNMVDNSNDNSIDHASNNNNNHPHIVDIVAGMGETVAMYSDGSSKVLIKNDVVAFAPTSFTSISIGMFHMVGLHTDGTVSASIIRDLESLDVGQCNVNNWTDIVEVSAGASHTVGLRSNGTVVAAGSNMEQ